MSVMDILADTRLSTRSFYRHFEAKEALLVALVRREAESVARSMRRAIENAKGPVARVDTWLECLLDTFFEPRRAKRSALFTAPSAAYAMVEELAEIRWILAQPLAEVLRAGHEAGVLKSSNPETDAISMFAIAGTAAQMGHANLTDRDAVRDQVVRFAWPALGLIHSPTTTGARQPARPGTDH